MDFFEKLEFLMEKNNINNLNALSTESEIPYMTLKNFYNRGIENVRLSTIQKLADFFDVTLDYLMREEVNDPNYGRLQQTLPNDTALLTYFHKLNDTGQDEGIKRVEELTHIERYTAKNEETTEIDSLRTNLSIPIELNEDEELEDTEKDGNNFMAISYFDSPASAGHGTMIEPKNIEEAEERIFPVNMIPTNATFAVRLSGDSMTPPYRHGEIIFVESTQQLEPNEIGVMTFNGHTYCKQIAISNENIVLRSLNPKYEDILVKSNDSLYIHGRVVGSYFEVDNKTP